MKKLLIINGHPDKESFCYALSAAFMSGIDSNRWSIETLHLTDLEFNPVLAYGYRKRIELEPDLAGALEKIKAADHLVWVFPMWWYSLPALLKGFIDRTFLPGIAFAFKAGKAFPEKYWKGKSAHIIMTSDTPRWYDYLFMGSPALNQFRKGTLQFCGINPVKVTYIAPMRNCSEAFRNKWLSKVKLLAQHT